MNVGYDHNAGQATAGSSAEGLSVSVGNMRQILIRIGANRVDESV
jgi:hypothetical protein